MEPAAKARKTVNSDDPDMEHLLDKLCDEIQPLKFKEFVASADQQERLFSRVIPDDTEVLLLGESTHGTEEFYVLRDRLTRYLIQHKDFKVVLVEAEWPDIYVVNQYITTATGLCSKAKEALAHITGSGRHMWQNYVFVELVEWMKEYNAKHSFRPEQMVYLFGIDCQQIYRSLRVLYDALGDIDFNLLCEVKAAFSFFTGFTSEYDYAKETVGRIGSENIPEILQKVMSDFQWHHFDSLKKKMPKDHLLNLINVEQNLEVIINGEEYFRKRQLEPAGSQASWNTRDQHMTLTINRLRDRLPLVTHAGADAPPAKVIAWAHNSHIGDAAATARGGRDFKRNETWNLGQMVKQTLKNSYLLGFDTYEGTVTALMDRGGDGTETFKLKPAMPASCEYTCHQVCQKEGCDSFFIDLSQHEIDADVSKLLSTQVYHRYVGINYVPDNELQSHYSQASLIGQYHGFIFVETTSALRVLKPEELQLPASQNGNKTLATKQGHRRLVQEYRQIMRHPIPYIRVSPQEDNLWICHFLITCDYGDYKGGEYHGRLEFPAEYPMAPPKIVFMTPSGRFETETRICVSFSDYHPELWNPSWGIESVLVGLQSFMQEDSPGSLGSLTTSRKARQELAAKSHEFNLKNKHYVELFLNTQAPTVSGGDEAKEREEDRFCRYCRQSGGELISPCECQGGNKWVHVNCLAKWQYQAILSQSTHPKYQTGLEKKCNVCFSPFKVQQFTREQLMLTFTGAEMANLIQLGCLLIATEKSSAYNLRLVEQYPHLESRLSYWTKSVFLITSIDRYQDGTDDSITGYGLTQEITKKRAKKINASEVRGLKNLGLSCRHFIGGPVSPYNAFPIVALKTSAYNEEEQDYFKRVTFFPEEDISLWVASFDDLMVLLSKRSTKRANIVAALVEVRIYWGCARWGRVQLLGEIARGGWGLANPVANSWTDPSTSWELNVKRAVTAGKNDMSETYS